MIRENVETIRGRIEVACRKANRDPAGVTLLAVGKTFNAEAVKEVVEAGVLDVGENYVQELLDKKEKIGSNNIRWHFIGHLQSNKVKYIVPWIYLVHSVDNIGLASELNKRAGSAKRTLDVLIEVNTTAEDSKFGVRPDATMEFVKSLAGLNNICIAGLMTIGPFLPDPEGSRPMFRTLRELKDQIGRIGQPNVRMEHLSMGMTGDFEVAIDEGATIVRIGTAIFGRRTKKAQSL